MPDNAADRALQQFIWALVAVLAVVLAYALAAAYGAATGSILRWTGEVLLLAGIGMAAKGIHDVRREWTGRPGIWAGAQRAGRRISGPFWKWWNRLAAYLKLPRHGRDVYITLPPANLTFRGGRIIPAVSWGPPPSDASVEERLAWLELRATEAGQRLRRRSTPSVTRSPTTGSKPTRPKNRHARPGITPYEHISLTSLEVGCACKPGQSCSCSPAPS